MFGLYVHIPYCLQKCHYCDFVTFDLNHEITTANYTQLVVDEIKYRAKFISFRSLSSVYFGGGTPSILEVSELSRIFDQIKSSAFIIRPNAEITIEINPGTIDEEKLDQYLGLGINRFSVGVQTFNSRLLKQCGREHSVEESKQLLDLLKKRKCNYSLDLLFGQPHQSLKDLENDLNILEQYSPPHVSLYNLTVPNNHFFNQNRASEDQQGEMFELISRHLEKLEIYRYELSNFSKKGFEATHNKLYWTDKGYWGVGVSAHSYLPNIGSWGTRFWNSSSSRVYRNFVESLKNSMAPEILTDLSPHQFEILKIHEALTDYCHTSLRTTEGLILDRLQEKFGSVITKEVIRRLSVLEDSRLVQKNDKSYSLSPTGWSVANKVYLSLTFLAEDNLLVTR